MQATSKANMRRGQHDSAQPQKKARAASKILVSKFLEEITRGLTCLVNYGVMSALEKQDCLKELTEKNVVELSVDEAGKWCATTLIAQAEKINKLPRSRKFFKEPPQSLSTDQFIHYAMDLATTYEARIKRLLRDCADAKNAKRKIHVVGGLEPLLPLQPSEVSSTALQIFEALDRFFKERRKLSEDQSIADAQERVLNQVWNEEKVKQISYSEGQNLLTIATRLCGKKFEEQQNDWVNRFLIIIEKGCDVIENYDSATFCLNLIRDAGSRTFPLSLRLRELAPIPVIEPLWTWAQRHQLAPLLQYVKSLPGIIRKFRAQACEHLQGRVLHDELISCDALEKFISSKYKEKTTQSCEFHDGVHSLPAHQVQVMANASSVFREAFENRSKTILLKNISKQGFDLLYKGVIQNVSGEPSVRVASLFRLAVQFKIQHLYRCAFQALLESMDAYQQNAVTVIEIERQLDAAPHLSSTQTLKWQKARDQCASEWLSENPAEESLNAWLEYQKQENLPKWKRVQKLQLVGGVSPAVIKAVAQLPHLEELHVEDLALLHPVQSGDFSSLNTLVGKLKGPFQNLEMLLGLPFLTTLNISCDEISHLSALKNLTERQQLHLSLLEKFDPSNCVKLNILKQLPRLTCLDLSSKTVIFLPKLLQALPALKLSLRLSGTPTDADFAAYAHLPVIHLLELKDDWNRNADALPALSAKPPSILCLGRGASLAAHLASGFENLEVVERYLSGESLLNISKMFVRPVKELILHVQGSKELDLTSPMKTGLLSLSKPSQMSYESEEVLLFSERFLLTGSWKLGGYYCHKLSIDLVERRLTLGLTTQDVNALERDLIENQLLQAFPQIQLFILQWKSPTHTSIWYKDKTTQTFHLII